MFAKNLYRRVCTRLFAVNISALLATQTVHFFVCLRFPSVDVADSYSCSLNHANPLLLTLLLTYLQICAPPPFSILSLADSVIRKRYIGVSSLSVPDVRRLFSALPLPEATVQIKYLTLFIPAPPQLSPSIPCIKYSSDLCCVESTLHNSLKIRPPRQEACVLFRLCVFALSFYSLSLLLLLRMSFLSDPRRRSHSSGSSLQ